MAKEYGIKIVFSPGSRTFRVRIDKELMGIALANILDNAMKYNVKNGEVDILLENEPGSDSAKLTIKDTGVGIPEEEMKKLFQKFYRGTNVVQMEPNGSGLGLYITKNIIEGQGGKNIGYFPIRPRNDVFRHLAGYKNLMIILGIDPGKRPGRLRTNKERWAGFYPNRERHF